MSIATRLDDLALARVKLQEAELEAAAYIPEAVSDRIARLEAECKDLEAEVKQAAKHVTGAGKHTLRGKILQLVHTNRVSYPKAALEAEVPERYLVKVRKTADVWSIRKAAK